jgi:hypothetical protein
METPNNLPKSKVTGLRKALGLCTTVAAIAGAIMMFSFLRARRACDVIFKSELSPPRSSTRFVFDPDRHMDGAEPGFNPGWVVTYAGWSRNYGTSFLVSFLGKVQARGTPAFVTDRRKKAEGDIEEFRRHFALLDAAVNVGDNFSNVVAVLGPPRVAPVKGGGLFVADYDYEHPLSGPVGRVTFTNGFSLVISNNIIVRKGYSYSVVD